MLALHLSSQVEEGGSCGVQGHPVIYHEFNAKLEYGRYCFKANMDLIIFMGVAERERERNENMF